ncbi:tyrosine/serine/threonine protein phosphatase [Taxawa tesnikishii (nom. ined.)]|nr:tyrosine/serine/threonine protein phosphatase [Dothideales sp. JES 119]
MTATTEDKLRPDGYSSSQSSKLSPSGSGQQQTAPHHQHHESTSTSASESTDSSPTTTISTVDDSSVTEMSPGSSPESPLAKPPPSNFAIAQLRPYTADDSRALPSSAPFFELQRPNTPGKKARNLKNLAVNTSGSLGMGRAASTPSLPVITSAVPAANPEGVSTAFSKPPSPPRRKAGPLGLTIMTPANSNLAGPQMKLAIPATPSLTRPGMLRHFQSSPSLPRMDTSVHTFGRPSQLGFAKHTTPESDPKEDDEEEQNFDIPQSREEKPEAYPNGPICVYEPHIDLYLEPTAQQALEYDVILNVASEVRNPFTMDIAPPELEPEIVLDGGGGMRFAPRRNLPLKSSGSAHLENPLSAVPESSPSTPRATPPHDKFPMEPEDLTDKKQPEYIHIPWEHNTDIVPDLLRLVRIIDDRVQNGKRVLIHCQCGVSRSATLVVAYGLYKDPSMSVREAYDAVKARSKWIGPNMNLIMQLQEFAGSLTRPNVKNNIYGGTRHLSPILTSPPYEQWARPDPLPEATAEPTAPKTAPLVSENVSPQEATARSNVLGVSPGPSSAPSGLSWPSRADVSERPTESKSTRKESAAYVDPAGHVVPVVKIIEDNSTPPARRSSAKKARPLSLNLGGSTSRTSTAEVAPAPFLSPRSEEFSMTALQPPKQSNLRIDLVFCHRELQSLRTPHWIVLPCLERLVWALRSTVNS